MAAEKQWKQKTISQNLLVKILWYMEEFLLLSYFSNEDFKMEVEQTVFVTHLIIKLQYNIIDY